MKYSLAAEVDSRLKLELKLSELMPYSPQHYDNV